MLTNWPSLLTFKRFLLGVLLIHTTMAHCETTGNNAEGALNSSPNDISQLLASLENEKESLISQTPFTPLFKKVKNYFEQINNMTRINMGMDYIPLYEHAVQNIGKQNAAGGELHLFGRWSILKDKPHSPFIGFKLEEKHKYTETYPGQLAEQFYSTIKTVSGYEQLDPALTELWLQSYLITNRMAFRIGKVDLTSIMNSYAFDSRRFYFLSDVFTSAPAINKPSKSLGLIAALKIISHVYLAAGIANLNGGDDSASFNTLNRGEYIKAIEFGYRDKVVNPQSDNYHVFLWESDAQKELNLPRDYGFSFVLQKNFASRFIPFVKANFNSGKVKEIKQLYTSGFGYHYPFNGKFGLLGFAAGYAILANKQLGNQVILESFYRVQLTPFSQLTPDFELIYTPLISQWVPVANLRYRIAI